MAWAISGILLIIVIVLYIKQTNKTIIDNTEKNQYKLEVEQLRQTRDNLKNDINEKMNLLQDYQDKILVVQDNYKKELNKKISDLDIYFANQKRLRQEDLDIDFDRQLRERTESLNLRLQAASIQAQEKINQIEDETNNQIEYLKQAQDDIAVETTMQEQRFEALLEPLKKYELNQQERLYWTIQVPEEYKNDIDFLLTTVSQKIQHPDIINKLIWAEYVKPYIENTFKRAGIKDEPGIYKITNIQNNKCYIGKSTNIKKRLSDHFKSSIGIKTVADQYVHHEILKTGYWNWMIEPIIYCEKERLNELEKYYIDFFKSNVFGYNKTSGGEG